MRESGSEEVRGAGGLRTGARLAAACAVLVAFVPARALAQQAESGGAPAPKEVAEPAPRVHVRSSHTVDVIAPGEKVESILTRTRVERAVPPPDAAKAGTKARPEGRGNAPRPPGERGQGGPGRSPRTQGEGPRPVDGR